MRLHELLENQSSMEQVLKTYESLSDSEKTVFQELVTTNPENFKVGETRTLGDEEFKWLGAQWASKKSGKVATKDQALQISTNQTVTNKVADLFNSTDKETKKLLRNHFQNAGKTKKDSKYSKLQRAGDIAGNVAADLASSLRKVTGGVAPKK